MKIKISDNIRALRKERSMTQEQLAEILGVTVGAVYKWEAGLSMPEVKLIMEIADYFEISVDALLGYEKRSGNSESVKDRIMQCILRMDYEEGEAESKKALRKYPNNFEIVYVSALMYQLRFQADKDESAAEKSNELFKRAILLLDQNTNSSINEATIRNAIAGNYFAAGKTEQALQTLKENNICNINSSMIGLIYAMNLRQPYDANPYLIKAFGDILGNVLRTMAGISFMYAELGDEKCMDAAFWLCGFWDSLKNDRESIVFTDKLKAVLLVQCAVWRADSGRLEEARKLAQEGYALAARFDAQPVYNMRGIKFLESYEDEGVSIDGLGKTAMEAIENVVFSGSEQTKAHEFVKAFGREYEGDK